MKGTVEDETEEVPQGRDYQPCVTVGSSEIKTRTKAQAHALSGRSQVLFDPLGRSAPDGQRAVYSANALRAQATATMRLSNRGGF